MFTLPSGLAKRTTPDCFLACLDCAKSKAKCEKKFPCERCVRRNIKCQVRLTQRGPGRSSGFRAGRRHSSKSTETSIKQNLNDSVSSGPQETTKLESQTNIGQYISGNTTYSQPGCKTDPYIDVFLPIDDQLDTQYLDDIQYLCSTETGKEEQCLNISLDPFMQESYFQLPDIDDFSRAANMDSQDDPFNLSLSSGSQSSYALTPEAFHSALETDSSIHNEQLTRTFIISSELTESQYSGLEGWPIFQCNPITPSNSCPDNTKDHLKTMFSALDSQQWSRNDHSLYVQHTTVEQILDGTRDRLNATIQKYSNKAQKIHGLINSHNQSNTYEGMTPIYLILPAANILEAMIYNCINSFQHYYPFITTASLKPNEILESGNNTVISSLKLVLLLTAGAMNSGAKEKYRLGHGLLEICRIWLFQLASKNTKLWTSPEILHCVLLFTILGAWSGDKWQIDTAIYQKAMYLEMIQKSGFLHQEMCQHTTLNPPSELVKRWKIWKEQEARNRLVYSWVILDQEICLFQDSISTLFTSSTDFNTPVPSPDAIFHTNSAEKWAQELDKSSRTNPSSPSLREYLKRFRETENVNELRDLPSIVIRLVLCYIQMLVMQIRVNITDTSCGGKSFRAVLVSVRLDEARDLLQKWYALVKCKIIEEACPTIRAAMILYHLIVLNTLVSFPEIERLAREENAMPSDESSYGKRPHHLEDTQHIYFHCGQILGIIRSTPEHERPPWWPGAIYRVALIAWANSMVCQHMDWSSAENSRKNLQVVVLDTLLADHPLAEAYLSKKEGIPMFSDNSGITVSLKVPGLVLAHCANFLGTNPQTSFIKGIRQKLLSLIERWKWIE